MMSGNWYDPLVECQARVCAQCRTSGELFILWVKDVGGLPVNEIMGGLRRLICEACRPNLEAAIGEHLGDGALEAFRNNPGPKDRCCAEMLYHLQHRCLVHDKYECPDTVLVETKDGKVGISIKDGGTSFIEIKCCPWCGKRITQEA